MPFFVTSIVVIVALLPSRRAFDYPHPRDRGSRVSLIIISFQKLLFSSLHKTAWDPVIIIMVCFFLLIKIMVPFI